MVKNCPYKKFHIFAILWPMVQKVHSLTQSKYLIYPKVKALKVTLKPHIKKLPGVIRGYFFIFTLEQPIDIPVIHLFVPPAVCEDPVVHLKPLIPEACLHPRVSLLHLGFKLPQFSPSFSLRSDGKFINLFLNQTSHNECEKEFRYFLLILLPLG